MEIGKFCKINCRFGDEKKLMQFHQELEDVIEDQLSLGFKLSSSSLSLSLINQLHHQHCQHQVGGTNKFLLLQCMRVLNGYYITKHVTHMIIDIVAASIHYLRSHYQEAIDIYKRILLDNR